RQDPAGGVQAQDERDDPEEDIKNSSGTVLASVNEQAPEEDRHAEDHPDELTEHRPDTRELDSIHGVDQDQQPGDEADEEGDEGEEALLRHGPYGRPGSASAFLQASEGPDPARVAGEFVGAPSHPQRPEDLLESLIADELAEGLVRRGTAERHVRGPGGGDEASIQVSRDGSALGSNDPRTDFTRIPAGISREETADRAPGFCDQERGRHFFRHEVKQGASVRAEIGRVESGEAIEIVESDRTD